jgi:DNA-binding response OmpR family regulator
MSEFPKILIADDDLEIQKMVAAALKPIGADDHLDKPFTFEELADRVRALLE